MIGGNAGIGKETALDLAKRKARVILACRSKEKAEAAVEEIKKQSGNTNVAFMKLDLSSLESVKNFAAEFLQKEARLDILINNAGKVNLYFTCNIYQDNTIYDFLFKW